MVHHRAVRLPLALLTLLCSAACSRGQGAPAAAGQVAIVLQHQPLWGAPAPFHELLDRFRAAHPEIALRTVTLPNGSDLARELLVTALEGGSDDFDVFAIDVVWAPEFARAGWLADLSARFPAARLRQELLPGPVEAVLLEGRTFAVPWYLDVGLLYFRTDLLPRAPRTYAEIDELARGKGFLWQGRQYEGLSCNFFEALWGFGGEALVDGRIALDTAEARAALGWLRASVVSGLSPRSVLSSTEEETRRAFQDGRAALLRNWPYVWAEVQAEGSKVRGKVAVAPMPGGGALGGWQLAVNANVSQERQRAAGELIAFLTSHEAAVELALHYSRIPARTAVYADERVKRQAPFIASLLPMARSARPRPVTPYYLLASDAIQGELSAAVAGLRTPAEALSRAQKIADHLEGR